MTLWSISAILGYNRWMAVREKADVRLGWVGETLNGTDMCSNVSEVVPSVPTYGSSHN